MAPLEGGTGSGQSRLQYRTLGAESGVHESADAVNRKAVDGVVNLEQDLEARGKVGGDRCQETDGERRRGSDETCCGRDADETGDDARAERDGRPLARVDAAVGERASEGGEAAGQQPFLGGCKSKTESTHKSMPIQVKPPIAAATLVTIPAWTLRRFIAASEPPLNPNLRPGIAS